jgi:hypothetical protein
MNEEWDVITQPNNDEYGFEVCRNHDWEEAPYSIRTVDESLETCAHINLTPKEAVALAHWILAGEIQRAISRELGEIGS